jgi:hypothetical protein
MEISDCLHNKSTQILSENKLFQMIYLRNRYRKRCRKQSLNIQGLNTAFIVRKQRVKEEVKKEKAFSFEKA